MPRTIEGLVEAHELATERRARGQNPWEGELTFMHVLAPLAERFNAGDITLTSQKLLEAFHAAAKEVRAKVPQAQGKYFNGDDEELENFVLTLEEWTVSHLENCSDILDEFDDALDRLYDWANRNRWWISPGI
jgi:hypothetical protein